jgi:hypothetical protein
VTPAISEAVALSPSVLKVLSVIQLDRRSAQHLTLAACSSVKPISSVSGIQTSGESIYEVIASSFDVAEACMSRLTFFLARLIGLFTVLLIAALLLRGSTMVETAIADKPLMFTYAIISLAIGLAMILGHNVWSGGALPVVVTLVGWLILAKGLLLLFLTPEVLTQLFERMQYGAHIYLYVAPSLVIGLYLTWAGFTAPTSRGL